MTNRTDNFNRADSSTAIGTPSDGGSDWAAVGGGWGISGNQAYNANNASQSVAYLESNISDCDVQVTFTVNGGNLGILARFTDDNNYLVAVGGGSGYYLFKKEGGSFTQLGSTYNTGVVPGDVGKFSVNGTALTLYVNGVSRITATESLNQTATKHGIRCSNDITTRFEDFSITALGGGGLLPFDKFHQLGPLLAQ